MKTAAALAALTLLAAQPAGAQKPSAVLDEAKRYTDQKVAAETAARTAADTAQGEARAAADASLQAQITAESQARSSADTALQAKIDTLGTKTRTFRVGAGAFAPFSGGRVGHDGICSWPIDTGQLGVEVPVLPGSVITSVVATIRDYVADVNDIDGNAAFIGQFANPLTGWSYNDIQVATSGTGVKKVTWTGNRVIQADEYFTAKFLTTMVGNSELAICGLTITYTVP